MENLGKEYLQKTEKSKKRFDELTELVMRPEIIADNREWKKLVKERNSLEELAQNHENLREFLQNLENCEKDLANERMKMTKTMPFWKFARLRAAKKAHFLPWNFAECIRTMPNEKAGGWNIST